MMKSKWKIFMVINTMVITSFALTLVLEMVQVFLSSARLNTPFWGILFIAGFSTVIYLNCTRNISLCKVILHNKRDITIKPEHDRNLLVLFTLVMIFLGYGLIRGYDSLRFSFYMHNLLHITAYFSQVITVICGTYTLFQQSSLSKLAAAILEKEINNSIEEIGS